MARRVRVRFVSRGGAVKAIEVVCPVCHAHPGEACHERGVWGPDTILGHAHGGRSRLVAIRSTLARAEALALDDVGDRTRLERMLMEALS